MFYLLNGGDPHEFIQELDYSGEPGSREVLERWGIRWNPLIEQDVNLIWSGYEPKFFMLEDDWAAKYRHNHGVRFVSEEGRFIHGHEFEEMAQELDREIQYEIEQWGIDRGWCAMATLATANETFSTRRRNGKTGQRRHDMKMGMFARRAKSTWTDCMFIMMPPYLAHTISCSIATFLRFTFHYSVTNAMRIFTRTRFA